MRRRALVVLLVTGLVAAFWGTGTTSAATSTKNPVLITAGLLSPGFALDPLAARLRADGWKVYTLELPGLGTGDIALSANAVTAKVNQIRTATGAAKVDLVGHSEGGLVNRYYLKFLGGTAKVGRYVSLGTPQHGTALANLAGFFTGCIGITACLQMQIGSSFLNNLNAGDDTPGTVAYTAIATTWDELVRPVSTAYLDGGASNLNLQSFCWFRVVGHLGLILDGSVYGLVRSALRGSSPSTNCFAL